ncbi:CsbD family protein [Kitasatospora sp. NBC_01300]|uniref:CsbD family protein n=1 Tax=Kitasatospora sp. NBC_01300 TaxID=2903574 RepID=UPI00352D9774|nr:CsbD family protein [Kitasatospora sp. NBC_01300]
MSDLSNKARELGGKAKEKVGDLTGDEELKGEGQADQVDSKVRQAADNVKDAVQGAADRVKGALKRND